jgi:hypothetical protein
MIETSARRWRELSTCGVAAMLRMSFSSWYNLSTSSVEGESKVSRSAAAVDTFWLTMSLARARALVRSTVMHRSITRVDLRWCSSANWASMAASPSSPHHCVALCSTSTRRAWACACCSSIGLLLLRKEPSV